MSDKKISGGFFKMLGRHSSSKSSSAGHSGNAQVSIPDVAQDTDFTSHQQVAPQQTDAEQGGAYSRARPSWPWMRKGKIAYARKSVPMPIKETFQMSDHLPERIPTPTEDEADDHESIIQIIEHNRRCHRTCFCQMRTP
jgi:hypothetical protein